MRTRVDSGLPRRNSVEYDATMTVAKKDLDRAAKSLEDAYGSFERSYAADVLTVPPVVKLDGDRLRWWFRTRMTPPMKRAALRRAIRGRSRVDAARSLWIARRVLPGTDLLRGFACLADAPTARIVAFAQKWGVLGICQHNLPSSHSLECTPNGWDGRAGWETIARWRHYARRASSLILVASRLRESTKWRADGTAVLPWTTDELRPLTFDMAKVLLVAGRLGSRKPVLRRGGAPARSTLQPLDMWQVLTDAVNEWLDLGDVRPRLLFSGAATGNPPRLVLAPPWKALEPEFPLFGALGIQLMFTASTERGIANCSVCGGGLEPGRPLRGGVRHYCDDCRGSGAMQRVASRDYRARLRARAAAGVPGRRTPRRGR